MDEPEKPQEPPKVDRRKKKPSERVKKFVREYVRCLNATKAAKAAGYAPGGDEASAASEGARLLRNDKIYALVQAAIARQAARIELTSDRVLQEAKALGLSDISHYLVDDLVRITLAPGAPANAMAAISSVKYIVTTDSKGNVTRSAEIKLWDKPGTIKILGRHTGTPGFSQKVEVSGPGGGPMQVQTMTAEEAAREIAALEAEARGEGVIDVTPVYKPKDGA